MTEKQKSLWMTAQEAGKELDILPQNIASTAKYHKWKMRAHPKQAGWKLYARADVLKYKATRHEGKSAAVRNRKRAKAPVIEMGLETPLGTMTHTPASDKVLMFIPLHRLEAVMAAMAGA